MVLFIPSADTTGKNRYHCLPLISPRKFLDPSFHLSDFPGGLDGKESACNAGDLGSIPRLGRSSGEGNGHPLQYSCLENPLIEESGRIQSMGSQSQTWLSAFTFFTYQMFILTEIWKERKRWACSTSEGLQFEQGDRCLPTILYIQQTCVGPSWVFGIVLRPVTKFFPWIVHHFQRCYCWLQIAKIVSEIEILFSYWVEQLSQGHTTERKFRPWKNLSYFSRNLVWGTGAFKKI